MGSSDECGHSKYERKMSLQSLSKDVFVLVWGMPSPTSRSKALTNRRVGSSV